MTLAGEAIFVLGGLGWGLYAVLLRRWAINPPLAAAIVCCLSWLLAPIYLAGDPGHLLRVDRGLVISQAIFHGLLTGVGAMLIFGWTISVLGPSRAALFPSLVPVFGIGWAFVLLGEVPTRMELLARPVIDLGLLWAVGISIRKVQS